MFWCGESRPLTPSRLKMDLADAPGLSIRWSYTCSAKISFNLGLTFNVTNFVSCSNHHTFYFHDHTFNTFLLHKYYTFHRVIFSTQIT
jgi:hypothetical protein